MIKKMRSKLSIKVFLLTAILILGCSAVTIFCLFQFAPYIYSYSISDMESVVYELSEELSSGSLTREDGTAYFEIFSGNLSDHYDNEYLLHIFQSTGEEVLLSDLDTPVGKRMEDFNATNKTEAYQVSFLDEAEKYTMFVAQNREKESQVVESLYNSLPTLGVVILVVSAIAAFFYSWYITAPIKKVSKISKQMADMDFSSLCPVERPDEIGALSNSLNGLSCKLTTTLLELQEANQKLQADMDRERQLERQRIEFFAAASHELKTPITIIKGQLQGMMYQVGRYKDRETYLAKSLEVTDTLEKTVQELLNISRLDTWGFTCNKKSLNLGKLINNRLVVYKDLFVQNELEIEKAISSELYVFGDRQLLQKALDNLLSNAAVYSPKGNYVFVKLWEEAGKINLTIENAGVHISDQDIPKLFEAFYRVDQSRNRKAGGTGLGLYIVKTILDLHGAEIEITDTLQGVMVSVQF